MESAHIVALSAKHAELDERIFSESRRPLPNEALLQRLKREKLRIKQEIVGI
ncbi:hypothetical protein BSL82_07245 [Tardibacter chloracetimidivorans]|uniref:DUF465 domain-containing protein n=1 Tax=Tardibacter chloracetimidivorans TaxID=1921510 RepID=A0A1L3ZU22_9SPHN|nr:YdcH family protein [Tardibacter chloracetimidivorans]API59128.1 hypothetical protein BSL82_07245 [Tardibacter chloracetimidivorans]